MYLDFRSFCVNEGAALDKDGSIILRTDDTPGNNDEVLKTQSGRLLASEYNSKRDWDNPQRQHLLKFPIYSSLGITDYSGQVDHEGRFKYTMDQLKNGNIKGGDENVKEFLKYSFRQLGLTQSMKGVKYIVSVGSTKGLVKSLSSAAADIFNAKIIHLPKFQYINAGDAIDFEDLKRQITTQAKGETTFQRFKRYIVDEYINTELSDDEIVQAILNAETTEDLKRLLKRQHRYLMPRDLVWDNENEFRTQLEPFIVRSTGKSFRGLNTRKLFKNKYDYDYAEFMDAVAECATKYGTKMLIVDDNRKSGTDIKNITNSIIGIANTIKSDRNLAKNWETNFAFYVMYDMNPTDTYFRYTLPNGESAKSISLNNRTAESFRKFAGL